MFLSGFSGGKDGYHTYRIPSLVVTAKGRVLAFCEGRKNSWGDSGDIDLLVKRSTDDGLTWSKPGEITGTTKKPDWTWYATGPGSGIQIQHGSHKSRLDIPCDHIEAESKHYHLHIIFSDDHGKTWQLGGRTPQHQVNECQVVELTGGRLMLNMRNYNRASGTRQTAVSNDGGITWLDQTHDATLIEPICQAAVERLRWPQDDTPGVVFFSNPASTAGRVNLTVRASFDDAKTCPLLSGMAPATAPWSQMNQEPWSRTQWPARR